MNICGNCGNYSGGSGHLCPPKQLIGKITQLAVTLPDQDKVLRSMNPKFLVSSGGEPKSRKALRSALFAGTSDARRALVLAEHYANQLDLPEVAQQIAMIREMIETTHVAVRRVMV